MKNLLKKAGQHRQEAFGTGNQGLQDQIPRIPVGDQPRKTVGLGKYQTTGLFGPLQTVSPNSQGFFEGQPPPGIIYRCLPGKKFFSGRSVNER